MFKDIHNANLVILKIVKYHQPFPSENMTEKAFLVR